VDFVLAGTTVVGVVARGRYDEVVRVALAAARMPASEVNTGGHRSCAPPSRAMMGAWAS
jgi:hypothetical protein